MVFGTWHRRRSRGRSQDVDGVAADIWGPTDGDRAGGSEGADRGPMELSIVAGSRDLGTAAATSIVGGARVPKDWSDAGVTEDTAAKEVEVWSAADGLQVCSRSTVTTGQGGAGGTRSLL